MKSFKEWKNEASYAIDVPDSMAFMTKGHMPTHMSKTDARDSVRAFLMAILQDLDAGKHIDPVNFDVAKAYLIALQKKEITGQA